MKTNIVIFLLVALVASATGGIITYAYILNNIYKFPYFGEIDYRNGQYDSGLIIREAKKVVVEQDRKISETINSVQPSIAGIFKKIRKTDKKATNISSVNILEDFYYLDKYISQGLVITSDGWIISSFKPQNKGDSLLAEFKSYVVIIGEQIYNIDKVISDNQSNFVFIHINGKDLPVRNFADNKDIENGEKVVVVNFDFSTLVSSIVDYSSKNDLVKLSDLSTQNLKIASQLNSNFFNSFIFDLSGNVVGFVDGTGAIKPIDYFRSAIKSLLKYQQIKRPFLGIYYVDLDELIKYDGKTMKGVLVYNNSKPAIIKNSPAYKAGLEEGDVIISIDNIIINKSNNLSNIIQRYVAGDKISIKFLRKEKEKTVDVVLDELK